MGRGRSRLAWLCAVALAGIGGAGCGTGGPATRLEAGPGGPARFEDADLRAEVALDGDALALTLANRGPAPLEVRWEALVLVGADHREAPLAVATPPGPIAPGLTVRVRVLPPGLPPPRSRLEVVVPTVVRGVERHYHFHLRAR
jgi:hypothetical protein